MHLQLCRPEWCEILDEDPFGIILGKLLPNIYKVLVHHYICMRRLFRDSQVPNGHILVDSPSIRRRNSTWKVRRNDIDFERRIQVEIMTSIRRANFDVDSSFKIGEISMSFWRGFFDVASTSNRRNFCTCCFHCIIS